MVTTKQIVDICKKYIDPEIGLDVYTLGLIYDINISGKEVKIKMTFTSPMCPYGPQMVSDITEMVENLGVNCDIDIVFDPPWQPSEDLRDMLGI